MSTGTALRRNDEQRSNLTDSFLLRNEFYQDGARLVSAVLATHRQGGGQLVEGWLADSRWAHGEAAQAWTTAGIVAASYAATASGGPYSIFNGSTGRYYITDASWQEAGTTSLFVWRWCYASSLAARMALVSKWNDSTNLRSWLLCYDTVPGFALLTSGNGTAVAQVTSSRSVSIEMWYFVAGYWHSSTLQQIFVGAATDTVLTINSITTGVPVLLYNTTAPLSMGATGNPAAYWRGYIGVGATRFNVPSATISGYATRLFHLTRWFYQE
jgi:hypothetical protein